ncbi:hypothetical protein [Acidithiobacillus sp.]|uniref:hypothetical protein n=1 Tax=Acidithiobacillus sp. TaxID=1872118 RepID=UPI0025B86CF0|nr:hypothetical protein [Acidithiobacillus sp.]
MQPQKSRPGAGTAHATTSRSNDTPIDRVLHRLDKVKRTAPDKWIALCPAHDDKRPSLSIKEGDDHRVLLKCWSGCGAAEIVSALGLSLADLFPGNRRSLSDHGTGPMRRPFDYRDALQGIAHEATVARLIIEAANSGQEMDVESLDRLAMAEERISDALQAAGGTQ